MAFYICLTILVTFTTIACLLVVDGVKNRATPNKEA